MYFCPNVRICCPVYMKFGIRVLLKILVKSIARKAVIFAVNEIVFALLLLKVHFYSKECLGEVCVLHHVVRFAVLFVYISHVSRTVVFLMYKVERRLTSHCQPRCTERCFKSSRSAGLVALHLRAQ